MRVNAGPSTVGAMFRGVLLVAVLGGVVIAVAGPAAAAPGPVRSACTPGDLAPGCSVAGVEQTASPEQQLVEMFAPIVMLKQQENPCDRSGEAFEPSPVEVVFDDSEVALRDPDDPDTDDPIMMAPNVSDLAGQGEDSFLDFPGNPRSPGCDYERWAQAGMEGVSPVTYANIVIDEATGELKVQYWFWYVFNDWNNTHEGDWEMIQLTFATTSAAEALTQAPVRVSYSQHSGGETAGWTDEKFQREGNHPVVWAAAGSHASYYGSEVYLGWGEQGSGFGCDVTTGPSDRLAPKVVLLPTTVDDPASPNAWLAWEGRWGERQRAFFNGIHGPGVRERWFDPNSWEARLRDSSIVIRESKNLGPSPTRVFCRFAEIGSFALTRAYVYPEATVAILGVLFALAIILVRVGGSTLAAACGCYARNWHVFLRFGLMLIPIGLFANAVEFVLVDHPPGEQIFETMNRSAGARLAIALTVGGLQPLLGLVLIGPAVIEAVAAVRDGRTPTFTGCYQEVLRQLKTLFRAVIRPIVIVALLAISIVGIPWAIAKAVRWLFVSQAVLMDNAGFRESRGVSAGAVEGRWWRVAGIALLLSIIATAAGPIVGLIVLIVATPELRFINTLSSFIYAALLPLSVIGFTLLYEELRGRRIAPVPSERQARSPSDLGDQTMLPAPVE